MSYSKSTINYGLPDFQLSDTPDWVADIAQAFVEIDEVMHANAGGIVAAQGSIDTLNSALDSIRTSIDNLEELVGEIPDEVAQLRADVIAVRQVVEDMGVSVDANSTGIINLVAQYKTHLTDFATLQGNVNNYRALQVSAVTQLFSYSPEIPNETGEPLFALKSEIPVISGLTFKRIDSSKLTKKNSYPIPTLFIDFNIENTDSGIIFANMAWPNANTGSIEIIVDPGLGESYRMMFDYLGSSISAWFPFVRNGNVRFNFTNPITGTDFENMKSESRFSILTLGGV